MPVEIRELVIKVAAEEAHNSGSGSGGSGGGAAASEGAGGQDTIIRACVEKVLEILKDQRER